MRRMIPLILVVLVVLGSINVINSMVSSQIDSLNYSLGINIRPARRDSALESNIRAWNTFIEDIRESNIEVDYNFSFDDFAIFYLSNQELLLTILTIILILILIVPTLKRSTT